MTTALSRIVRLLWFALFFAVQQGSAQLAADSTKENNLHLADSAYARVVPLSSIGSLDRAPALIIPDSSRNFIDYTYTGDIFSMDPGMYTHDLSRPGQLTD